MSEIKNKKTFYNVIDDDLSNVIAVNATEWKYNRKKSVIKRTAIHTVVVKTFFIGIDANSKGDKPMLYATIILGGMNNGYVKLYEDVETAKNEHEIISEAVLNGMRL